MRFNSFYFPRPFAFVPFNTNDCSIRLRMVADDSITTTALGTCNESRMPATSHKSVEKTDQ